MNDLTPRKAAGAPLGNRNAVRLNPKVRAVIAHRLTNADSTWKSACKAVGCPERTFYKAKHSPHFTEHFKLLGRNKLLTEILPDAMHVYHDLIKSSQSDYVRADLAKDAMAQAGVRDRIDGAQRGAGIGSINITIGGRPGETVRISTQDVVHDGAAPSSEDERTD